MKSKEQIIAENDASKLVSSNLRYFVLLMIVCNLLVFGHLGQLMYARFITFPKTVFLGTTDAQSVCAPISLKEPMVADAVARDFAVTAITDIMTYDWTSWRNQINASTATYMTLEGRNEFRNSIIKWGILFDVVKGFQNASASQHAPAITTAQGVMPQKDGIDRYQWEITVPLNLMYRNDKDKRIERRDFYVTVVRTAKSPLNPKGIAISRLISSQPVNSAKATDESAPSP
jgi:Type-IV b secretion system, inner-membrane complex component